MPLPEKLPIALVGLRGVGKTTVGKLLAHELGLGFGDLDEVAAQLAAQRGLIAPGTSAGAFLAQHGLEVFRKWEKAALGEIFIPPGKRLVVATGGGVIEDQECRERLRERTFCVWLRAPAEVLAARVEADPTLRPPLVPGGALAEAKELARRREPWYREVAKLELDCGDLRPEGVVARLGERWRGGPSTP